MLRPTKFPDFMEKFDRSSYLSQTIIGQLYRQLQVCLALFRFGINLAGWLLILLVLTCTLMQDPSGATSENGEPFGLPEGLDKDLMIEGYEAFVTDAEVCLSALLQHTCH